MRRLPPQQIEKNLSDLIDLVRTCNQFKSNLIENISYLGETEVWYRLNHVRIKISSQSSRLSPGMTLSVRIFFCFCFILMLSLIMNLRYLKRIILNSKTFRNALNCPKWYKCFTSAYADVAKLYPDFTWRPKMTPYRGDECLVYAVVDMVRYHSGWALSSAFGVCVKLKGTMYDKGLSKVLFVTEWKIGILILSCHFPMVGCTAFSTM